MLAAMNGDSPARPCPDDGGRSVCENWQLRRVVIEATEKPRSLVAPSTLVPKRILYIDSEGWFITASDLYDREGGYGKRSRAFILTAIARLPVPAWLIWPFKRISETAMVDEDVVNGFSTVVFTPGLGRPQCLVPEHGRNQSELVHARADGPGRPLARILGTSGAIGLNASSRAPCGHRGLDRVRIAHAIRIFYGKGNGRLARNRSKCVTYKTTAVAFYEILIYNGSNL
jgi:hypothetical protein